MLRYTYKIIEKDSESDQSCLGGGDYATSKNFLVTFFIFIVFDKMGKLIISLFKVGYEILLLFPYVFT